QGGHDLARLHAREAALEEGGDERGGVLGGRRRQREADQRARAGMVADQGVGHLLGRIAPRLGATLLAVDAPDPGEEETEVVVQLGGRAHRRAGSAHGVLLLDGDGRPDVLDAVHVGAGHWWCATVCCHTPRTMSPLASLSRLRLTGPRYSAARDAQRTESTLGKAGALALRPARNVIQYRGQIDRLPRDRFAAPDPSNG